MNSTNCTYRCACFEDTNNDITGIGNRVAIYVSAIIGYFMTAFYPNDHENFRDTARTSLVTSAALIIAGIYSHYSSNGVGLSLVDAQIITMLVSIITAYCYTTASELDLGVTTRAACLMHGILSCAFGIIVYANASIFAQCGENSQIFVIFGHSISATNSGLRIFALIIFSLGLFEIVRKNRAGLAIFCLRCFTGNFERAEGPYKPLKPTLPTGIAVVIYLIVTTEQIILRNDLSDNANTWSFGQTLSIIMLLDQILKAFSIWRKSRLDRERFNVLFGNKHVT